jgi:glycosyltransferase involved in cell wall biosynthesis
MLRQRMKSILVITSNLQQASFRLRIAALVRPLAQRGFNLHVQVRPGKWLARRRLLHSAGQYDAVILQRKLLDPVDATLLRRSARRIIFDVDDAVMHHAHAVGWLSRRRTARRFSATVKILDHVVAGNQHLAAIFRDHGLPVTLIPTTVDPAHYPVRHHAASDEIRLVWIGSRSTLPYVETHLPALEQATQNVPGLKLMIIADATLRSPVLPIEFHPWSPETEAQALLHGDIGIAPTPLDEWTIGKSGFKIVQYMAAGLPVIASPVGANAELVRHGETGLLAEKPEDWPAAVRCVAGDLSLRQEMGSAGRQLVEQQYCIARATSDWAAILAAPDIRTRLPR